MGRFLDGKAPAGRVIGDKEQDRLADDVMDDLQAARGAHTEHQARSEEDDEIREEQAFTWNFARGLTEQLGPCGIRCTGMIPDGENGGFHIRCHDESGRQYNCHLSYDEYLEREGIFGADAGRETLALVCQKVLEAREMYFRRMQ